MKGLIAAAGLYAVFALTGCGTSPREKASQAAQAASNVKDWDTSIARRTEAIALGEKEAAEGDPAYRIFTRHWLAVEYVLRGRAHSWKQNWKAYAADLRSAGKLYESVCRDPGDQVGVAREGCKGGANNAEELAKVVQQHPEAK